MINQIKTQLKRFWKWIIALIFGGAVLAASALIPNGAIPSILVNGELITFKYTDENKDENLIIRTDRETYGGWDESDVYVMVENKSGKGQAINLQVFFPDESKSVAEISRLKLNVPYEIDVPDFKIVDYDCSITAVSSTTEETITEKKTCQRDEQIGSHKEIRYRDEWQPQTLSDFSIRENNILIASQAITEKDKKGFVAKKKIQTPILANEITYYKIKIKFPNQTKGEFFIEALGSEGAMGLLDPWYNASWLYRKKISINPAVVDADLVNFPILVALASSTNFDFTKARGDGFDVIFTKDDETTLLDFERERYATTTGNAEFWVEIPSVSSSTAATTTFYMYYGNSGAGDISSSTAVWDSEFKMVQHLTGAAYTDLDDSTVNDNDVSAAGGTPDYNTAAKIAFGVNFVRTSSEYLEVLSFTPANYLTVEAWVNADVLDASSDALVSKYESGKRAWDIRAEVSGKLTSYFGNATGDYAGYWQTNDVVFATGAYYHIVMTFSSSTVVFYVNGVEKAGTKGDTIPNSLNQEDSEIRIAALNYGATDFFFDGKIDEVRISEGSSAPRTAAWIKASYNSGNDSLLAYGSEESAPPTVAEPQMEVIIIE